MKFEQRTTIPEKDKIPGKPLDQSIFIDAPAGTVFACPTYSGTHILFLDKDQEKIEYHVNPGFQNWGHIERGQ